MVRIITPNGSRVALIAAVVGSLALASVQVAPLSATAADATLIVDQAATPGGDGSAARPFSTISSCAAVAGPGDTCLIGTGVYRETVVPAANGTDAAPVTFAAAPGADVTVSGADEVTGWTIADDISGVGRGKVWKAPADLSSGFDETVDPDNAQLASGQLFEQGRAMVEAQWPNTGEDPLAPVFGEIVSVDGGATGSISADAIPDFGDLAGGVIYFFGGWTALTADITSSSGNTISYTMPETDSRIYPTPYVFQSRFRVVGSKSLLDAEHEWYYDDALGSVYVWAADGGKPEGIEAKKRNYAFDLSGRSHIVVQGLGVFGSTIRTSPTSTDNIIDGISATYVSMFQTTQYDASVPFGGAYDIAHRGDTGIILHGSRNRLENSVVQLSAGNGVSIDGNENTVSNNLIRDVSYGGLYTAPIAIAGGSTGTTIERNTIYGTGRDGINMAENRPERQNYRNTTIRLNDISGFAALTYDLGGVYACCTLDFAGSRFSQNWVHDPATRGVGIYIDNGSHSVGIDHNVVWNTGDVGVRVNGFNNPEALVSAGTQMKIFNNTLATTDGSASIAYDYLSYAADVSSSEIRNNLMSGGFTSIPDGVQLSNNLIDAPDSVWQDAAAGDYRLAPSSPAIGAGIPVPSITENDPPDLGAYETGQPYWEPGCSLTECAAEAPSYGGSTVVTQPLPASSTTGLTLSATSVAAGEPIVARASAATASAPASGSMRLGVLPSTALPAQTLGADGSSEFTVDTTGLAPGRYSAIAGYVGGPGTAGSGSDAVAFTVTAPDAGPSATALEVELSSESVPRGGELSVLAGVTAASGDTPTGSVSAVVDSDAVAVPVQPLSGGSATLTIPTAGLSLGTHTVEVSYRGDAGFAASTASATFVVSAAAVAPADSSGTSGPSGPLASTGSDGALWFGLIALALLLAGLAMIVTRRLTRRGV